MFGLSESRRGEAEPSQEWELLTPGFKFSFRHCNPLMLSADLRTVIRNDSLKFSCASKLKGINFDSDFVGSRPDTAGNVES